MKRALALLLVSMLVGCGVAAALHHIRYGYRPAFFGPFDKEGTVTLASLEEAPEATGELFSERPAATLLLTDSFDFGTKRPGEKGTAVFEIQNVGTADLTLVMGETTCQCTSGRITRALVPPDETSQVAIEFTTKGGQQERFEQSAEIITNDPINRTLRVTIRGRVVSDIESDPRTWSFGDIAAGDSDQFVGRVFLNGPIAAGLPTATWDEADPSDDEVIADRDLAVSFEVMDADELEKRRPQATGGYVVTIDRPASDDIGYFRRQLTLQIPIDAEGDAEAEGDAKGDGDAKGEGDAEEAQADFIVPVSGRVVSPLRMSETTALQPLKDGGYRFDLGKISSRRNVSRKVFFILKGTQKDQTNLSVDSVTPTAGLSAELQPAMSRGSMKLYPMVLELDPSNDLVSQAANGKDGLGSVRIITDNPKVPPMELKVTYEIEP